MYWCYRDRIVEAHDNAAWHHVRRQCGRKTQRAWSQWRQYVVTRTHAKKVLHRVLVRRQGLRALRTAFCKRWYKEFVLVSRNRQTKLTRIARDLRRRRRLAAITAWRRHTHVDKGMAALRGRLCLRRRRRFLWRWRVFCRHASVSYTHLTLPTICSV